MKLSDYVEWFGNIVLAFIVAYISNPESPDIVIGLIAFTSMMTVSNFIYARSNNNQNKS